MEKRIEKMKIEVPVDVNVRLDEKVFAKALRTSKLYWEKIKPRLDLSEFLESFMENPNEFYRWFYTTSNLNLDKVIKKIGGDRK